jgi:acetylglutamate kinase
LAELTTGGAEKLIADGGATGGMQAKLNAARGALEGGVAQVTIAFGSAENVLARVLRGDSLGTRMILEEAHAL